MKKATTERNSDGTVTITVCPEGLRKIRHGIQCVVFDYDKEETEAIENNDVVGVRLAQGVRKKYLNLLRQLNQRD